MELILSANKKHNVPEVRFIILPLNYLGAVVLIAFYNSCDREIQKTTKLCYLKFFRETEPAGHIYTHTDKQEECVP